MTTWQQQDVFPIIARIIRAVWRETGQPAQHRDIVGRLLDDEEARPLIDAAHANQPRVETRERVASNMVQWFSQRITVEQSEWASEFERAKTDGRWAYRPIGSAKPPGTPRSGLPVAYGGVLILDGRFLLREPKDHFGGCAWTFPKGRPLPGESPEATALRETREETGLAAEVVMRIPGSFLGSRTENAYFIMRPTGRWQLPDDETWALRWVRPDEARALIRQSTDARVRDRDLKVLEAAAGLLGATQ